MSDLKASPYIKITSGNRGHLQCPIDCMKPGIDFFKRRVALSRVAPLTDRDDAAARPILVPHNTETVVVFSVQLSNPQYSFYVVIRRKFCVIVVGNELYARVSSNFPEEMTTAQSAPCRARPSDSPDCWWQVIIGS